ncbi:hypothetical protein F5050DRAFT_1813840 [Lentinula boryana]|uniref:Uncharacterized protein n=1 Tax=Lentinula boryana TaxID=40481 RepID=A0ABQ8PVX9_9AGAR|nr:hypothetical protein F5050DRAFT_1813840 [Lentinula boryana]
MSDYEKFFARALKRAPASSERTTPQHSTASDSSNEVQVSIERLLAKKRKRNTPEDYDLHLTSSVILDKELPLEPVSPESALDSVSLLLAQQAFAHITPARSVSDGIQKPHRTNYGASAANAVLEASRIQKIVDNALDSFAPLNIESAMSTAMSTAIQSILTEAENSSVHARSSLETISHPTAQEKVQEVYSALTRLDESILRWRVVYPDTAAVKVDNRTRFSRVLAIMQTHIHMFQASTLLT